MVSLSLNPLGAPLWASGSMPNLKPAPQARTLASQKDKCVSICCLCSSLGVAVSQELPGFAFVTVPQDLGTQVSLASRVRHARGVPLGAATKKQPTRHAQANSRIYSSALECGRGGT